jgi:alpha-L-fucosidase 2
LLKRDTERNLLTFSRGGVAGAEENIFAIDGNTGASSGIAEMLLQSQDGVHLLPALPKEWADGSVRGLRARGGFEVDIRWQAGALKSAVIYADRAGKRIVRYGRRLQEFEFKAGQALHLDESLQIFGS